MERERGNTRETESENEEGRERGRVRETGEMRETGWDNEREQEARVHGRT